MIKENNDWISVKVQLPPISDNEFYESDNVLCFGKENFDDKGHTKE